MWSAFSGLFDALGNLEFLNLRKNKITFLAEKVLNSLNNLKILQLTSNQLKFVIIL